MQSPASRHSRSRPRRSAKESPSPPSRRTRRPTSAARRRLLECIAQRRQPMGRGRPSSAHTTGPANSAASTGRSPAAAPAHTPTAAAAAAAAEPGPPQGATSATNAAAAGKLREPQRRARGRIMSYYAPRLAARGAADAAGGFPRPPPPGWARRRRVGAARTRRHTRQRPIWSACAPRWRSGKEPAAAAAAAAADRAKLGKLQQDLEMSRLEGRSRIAGMQCELAELRDEQAAEATHQAKGREVLRDALRERVRCGLSPNPLTPPPCSLRAGRQARSPAPPPRRRPPIRPFAPAPPRGSASASGRRPRASR